MPRGKTWLAWEDVAAIKAYIQASEDKNDVPDGSGQSAGAFEAKVGGAIIDLVHYKEKL